MMRNWDSYRDYLDALKIELEKLSEVRNDVMRRVRFAEEEKQQMMKPKTDEVVQQWLSKVQAVETEVDDLISQEIEDIVADKLQAVMNLITEGASVVADDEARAVTIPKDGGAPEIEEFVAENLPEGVPYDEGTIVGMDSIFTEVGRCLEEEEGEGGGYVGIIGLYGMGGVGKTTLLKQIYRNMLDNYGQSNFAVVIWVSVSKELRLEKIQEKIGMKIGLSDKVWKNKNFEEKASDILKILNEKKFVLLMDELWERVDLTKVGVPFPNPENSSKIVFTTRSLEICRLMEADRQFKINCLADEEAWELFKTSVGDETLHSHPELVDIARDISEECSGLPLALVSIGRALAGNKTPQEWRDVLGILTRRSRSTSSISGSNDQLKKDIYYNLKLSYDHLQNDMFKSCLLYCCLFPRDDKISKEHLIDCWIGEGFLDDRLGTQSQGYHIIDVLLSACLLEEDEEEDDNYNYVKMHNWIHDMSLWIATEIEEEKRNCFVCTDAGLTEPPEIEKWVNMTRIGFTNLENAPVCSHLQTLFLNKNQIEMIGGDFFQFMDCLKVLNLSDNPLQELPSEISNLVSLQHLDLSHTAIKSLPNQLGALKKLKCLNLESTSELCAIPPRLISTLSVLHVLRLQGCGFLDQSGEDSVVCKDAQLLIEELFCLKNLSMLSIGLRNSHALQKLLSSYRLQSCIQSLWLHSLQHPKSIVISLSYMNHLKTLRISKCEYLEELEVDFVGEAQAQAISNFYFLDKVFIESCPNLQDLTWLILAPNLKHLEISQCSELEEIIKVWKLSECPELRNLTPFLKLQILKLSNLPNLRSIYWCDLLFPDFKNIVITECPKLQISLPPHRFNKTIMKLLKKKLQQIKRKWANKELPNVLWAYWTTKRTATGETPYLQAFKTEEAVLPIEHKLASFRVQHFEPESNEAKPGASLNLLEEKQDKAVERVAPYQSRIARIARYFNRKVKTWNFKEGDLVNRKVTQKKRSDGVLAPNWEGPYLQQKITANVPSGPSSFNRKQVDPTGSDDICGSTISGFSTLKRKWCKGYDGNLEEFALQVLLEITNNFSEDHKIGTGSCGSVYQATLEDGRQVAIRRAEISNTSPTASVIKLQEDKDNAFLNELEFLSRLNHRNLVRLLGFCEDYNELVLVYEFMSNGSLHDHLHSLESSPLMSWPKRIEVALDAARGIEYLHNYAVPPIIHRDIKSSNILLDTMWTAKVSDFRLSLIGPSDDESYLSRRAAGTFGYMDPEYYMLQKLTTKSDVYSFGVVMLEMLSGYRAIHKNENGVPRNLVDFMIPYIVQDEIQRVLDPRVPPPTPNEIEALTYVGYLATDCVHLEGRDRPSMADAVNSLERALNACLVPPPSLSRSTSDSSI